MASELELASDQVIADSNILHTIVNGAATDTVTLASGVVVNTVAKELIELSGGLQASASSVATGQPATADYNPTTKTFVFEIPVGATGAQGATGATGAAGADGAGTGDLLAANNLSDIDDPAVAKVNLGITGGGFTAPDVHVVDQKSYSSAGGTCYQYALAVRAFNTFRLNTLAASIVSNKLSGLPAGDYWIEASAPSFASGKHQVILYVETAAGVLIQKTAGTTEGEGSVAGYSSTTRSFVAAKVTLSSGDTIKLQHFTYKSRATDGLGQAISYYLGEFSVFADMKIWKI